MINLENQLLFAICLCLGVVVSFSNVMGCMSSSNPTNAGAATTTTTTLNETTTAKAATLTLTTTIKTTTTTLTPTTITATNSTTLSASCQGQGAITNRQDLLNVLNLTESQLQNLTMITFPLNSVSCLSPGLFKGLFNLTHIGLYGQSRLSYIDANLFQDVSSSLQSLYLYYNNITTLSVNAFANLTTVHYLYLPNNKITTIDSNLFQDLSSLFYIFLSYNQITTLKANTFVKHVDLMLVDLSYNPLLTIESGAFYNLYYLIYINFNSTQVPVSLDHSLFSAFNLKNYGNFSIYFSNNTWSSSNSNLCDQNPKCIMTP